MPGRLVGIFIADAEGAPMRENASIEAIAGVGLKGDRYAGVYDERECKEVTLVEREAVTGANATGVAIGEHETRRNLLTEGVDLNELVGRTFRVGDVVLRATELCHPCSYLEKLTQPGTLQALKGRGGVRAEIVEGGTLRLGDEITVVPG